jgi:hypothetical protein
MYIFILAEEEQYFRKAGIVKFCAEYLVTVWRISSCRRLTNLF